MNYLKIEKENILNGLGIRVVLWCSGCDHHCKNCQNPITWDPNDGAKFDTKAKREIFNELSKDYISGITLTGGDPLHPNNLETVLNLVNEIRISFPEKQSGCILDIHGIRSCIMLLRVISIQNEIGY